MARYPGGSILLAALLGLLQAGAAAAHDYRHYLAGDPALPTPGTPSPGLLLMGGGDRNHEALRWFLDKAGNGHVVVLRASLGGEIGEELHDEVGGVASVETFVFTGRGAAYDPALLERLARADGIFIAGGDQSRYVRYWRGTPVAELLDAHVRAGKPLGGTSAGLAILGEFLYGAMVDGSLRSHQALADPLGDDNTIERDFLSIALLRGVVTDTHFSERHRLGRLFAFVAKAEALADGRAVLGLGVDEDAALAVEPDGTARVHATREGSGATVVRGGLDTVQERGRPLRLARVEATGIGAGSLLLLPEGRVEAPVFQRRYAVEDGEMYQLVEDAGGVAPQEDALHEDGAGEGVS